MRPIDADKLRTQIDDYKDTLCDIFDSSGEELSWKVATIETIMSFIDEAPVLTTPLDYLDDGR